MRKIRVLLKKDSPNSGFGYYHRGDKGYVVGYTQGDAVVILDNGKFARADINSIECIEEIKEISGNNGGISPNCELTEFEEEILMTIHDYELNKGDGFTDIAAMLKHKIRILNAAKKELQPVIDKALDQAREAGKAEALKDLPKWKLNLSEVSHLPDEYSIVYDFESGKDYSCATRMLECGNYRISISELLDKLPKEE
jgi:hypothetical protein